MNGCGEIYKVEIARRLVAILALVCCGRSVRMTIKRAVYARGRRKQWNNSLAGRRPDTLADGLNELLPARALALVNECHGLLC